MSDPILPWPLVKSGSHDHPTRTLQDLLNAHGAGLVVDGVFGPRTDAAVRHFQQSKGLTVDGVVGAHTWAAVIVTVRQGSSGDAVRGVQEEFAFRNLSGIPGSGLKIDGVFGPKTDAAVRGFQHALSVAVDGIVGPVTWRALVSGMLAGRSNREGCPCRPATLPLPSRRAVGSQDLVRTARPAGGRGALSGGRDGCGSASERLDAVRVRRCAL